MAKAKHKVVTKVIDRDKEREERARGDFRGPTAQRLAMATHGYEIGDDQQGGKVFFLELRPIAAMLKNCQIDGMQFSALDKFHKHWFNAKLGGGARSVDLNRVYAPDPFNYLDASERQWANRREYTAAIKLLAFQEQIVATNLILAETMTAQECGYGLGYRSPYRARSAAVTVVRGIADKFAHLWGMSRTHARSPGARHRAGIGGAACANPAVVVSNGETLGTVKNDVRQPCLKVINIGI